VLAIIELRAWSAFEALPTSGAKTRIDGHSLFGENEPGDHPSQPRARNTKRRCRLAKEHAA